MTAVQSAAKAWPRIHLVYFFLAFCDLLAVCGGLYLSHRQAQIFEASVRTDQFWDAHLDQVWSLGGLIQAANAPPNDVFGNQDPVGERDKFEVALNAVNAKLGAIKLNLNDSLSPGDRVAPIQALSKVESGLGDMAKAARGVFTQYSTGDIIGAGRNMALADRVNAETNRQLNASVQSIRDIKARLHRKHFAEASALKSYEYLIVGFILLMVSAAAVYGHSIGRMMTEKYRELQAATRDLVESEEHARIAARTDIMSGLPNRHGFHAYSLSTEFEEAAAVGRAGIIVIDLNGFKEINDSAGHLVGDKVINKVADRISGLMPNYGYLARIGGDEFAVVMTGENAEMGVPIYADFIVRSFDHPLDIDGMKYHVRASVGYSCSVPHKLLTPEQMLHNADVAMYDAKQRQVDRATCFHVGLEVEAEHRRELENDLRKALASDELYVEYQPVVSSENGKIVAAEALIRWNSPKRGQVAPLDFIPIAEGCGLVNEIGTFVLRRVCEDFARLNDITISVNVSAVQLKHPGFVDEYTRIVRSYGIDPGRIEIELTESLLVENPTTAARRLNALKDAGFKISLDDYGVGFSSLGYLKQLPIDKLKIDRTFVAEIGKSQDDNDLLASLSLMSRSLHLTVVAEGVETADQAKQLKRMHFDLLQGWHTGRPMAIDTISKLVAPTRRSKAA